MFASLTSRSAVEGKLCGVPTEFGNCQLPKSPITDVSTVEHVRRTIHSNAFPHDSHLDKASRPRNFFSTHVPVQELGSGFGIGFMLGFVFGLWFGLGDRVKGLGLGTSWTGTSVEKNFAGGRARRAQPLH